MGALQLHAGSFVRTEAARFATGQFWLIDVETAQEQWLDTSKLASVETVDEANLRRIGRAFALDATSYMSLASVDFLASIATVNEKRVVFAAFFKDGRKLLATTDSDTYDEIELSQVPVPE